MFSANEYQEYEPFYDGVKHHKPNQPLEDENETDKFDFFLLKINFTKIATKL
jgi:hypothetical protein